MSSTKTRRSLLRLSSPPSLFLSAVVTHRRVPFGDFYSTVVDPSCNDASRDGTPIRNSASRLRLESLSANRQASTLDFAIPEREREREYRTFDARVSSIINTALCPRSRSSRKELISPFMEGRGRGVFHRSPPVVYSR